ncbi:hypothetical protein AC249_AIPGENE28818 [Exaiptasia diaphana]|nr:hypothetical protein AC249_AIPGENE28818 [Exaiptasia diaphana]
MLMPPKNLEHNKQETTCKPKACSWKFSFSEPCWYCQCSGSPVLAAVVVQYLRDDDGEFGVLHNCSQLTQSSIQRDRWQNTIAMVLVRSRSTTTRSEILPPKKTLGQPALYEWLIHNQCENQDIRTWGTCYAAEQ